MVTYTRSITDRQQRKNKKKTILMKITNLLMTFSPNTNSKVEELRTVDVQLS